MQRQRPRSPLLAAIVTGLLVAGCGSTAGPSGSDGGQPSSAAATIASTPTGASSVGPTQTAVPPSQAPIDWNAALTLAPCPVPRPTNPACIDATANGATPARTAAAPVGGKVRAGMVIHNAASTASPPITLVLFTFEPPMLPTFLTAVDCNGCRITPGPYDIAELLEWPSLPPGDTSLAITLRVASRPKGIVGNDYEWLAGLFAKPAAEAIDPAVGIDASAAFALATGETTISR